jgi:cobalt transporter subunit CbtA
MLFRRIVVSALLVGALSGLLLTAVELWQVIPIIHSAERYEDVHVPRTTEPRDGPTQAVGLADKVGAAGAVHEHAASQWEPAEGMERTGYTLLANALTATGFGLLMLVAMAVNLMRDADAKIDWRYGLLWGAAGYAVFFIAPALGLPPQIPGASGEAPLEARQLWWLLAAACTAAALAGAAFGKGSWRWVSLGVLAMPYLLGAPPAPQNPFVDHPPAAAAELAELSRHFIWATAFANAVYWLALGSASGWAARRFLRAAIIQEA